MKAQRTLDAINAALEAAQEREHRSHLGASILGRKCAREIWYHFRWAAKELFEGRMLRLFDRGQREEERFAEWLRMAGAEVWTHDESQPRKPDGTFPQYRISGWGGHFGGSLDGVGRGIPDLPPGTPFLCEFKTHNDKSFKVLVEDGLCASKPEHFAQCQTYMFRMGLPWALYLGINKNDDSIFPELIQANPTEGERLFNRAGEIINSETPPPRIATSPRMIAYACRFCTFKDICHGGAEPEHNCRTCQFSRMGDGGKWFCGVFNAELSKEAQHAGCQSWKLKNGFKA